VKSRGLEGCLAEVGGLRGRVERKSFDSRNLRGNMMQLRVKSQLREQLYESGCPSKLNDAFEAWRACFPTLQSCPSFIIPFTSCKEIFGSST